MIRNCKLEEISDGRFYGLQDMVKVGCGDCKGCSACCQGMGKSLVLDPLDIHRLSVRLQRSFEELLSDTVELNLVDGVILPNLRMVGEKEQCVFLNEEGRCKIHSHRPGFCRIFPLGRYYEEGSFSYILQVNECVKSNKTKVKLSKWIDTPDLGKNQEFVNNWHYFLKDIQKKMVEAKEDQVRKQLSMVVLQLFYLAPYGQEHFYEEFQERLTKVKEQLSC
ncbi:YkgJ family cysteine cluster protein [Anaerosporobacter faecicola]|uniref:YkgJ family cysteine cluster protein n=1 Tax=Anaerosporobacter faecicola TaxID=2718714 RepID=UPI00143C06DA|nr:YkgJ family cysteine cluster protein [Anaerosporobacter faecicola]